MVFLKVERAAVTEQEANRSSLIIYLRSNSEPEQNTPLGNQLGRDLLMYNYINCITNQLASPQHLCAQYSSWHCKDKAWATRTCCGPTALPVPVVTRSSCPAGMQWGSHPVIEVCPHSRCGSKSFQKVLDKTARLDLVLQGFVRLKLMVKPPHHHPWSHWKFTGLLGCWGYLEWLIPPKQSQLLNMLQW